MRLTLFILAILSSVSLFAQLQKSEFYPEANGTIGKRTKVNALSFRTPNTTNAFYKSLNKRFGKPTIDGYFLLYSGYNKDWSKSKIIIRVRKSTDANLDGSKTNTVFIYVETKNAVDLLQPHSPSYKQIKKYFLTLFRTKVKNQKLDDFK